MTAPGTLYIIAAPSGAGKTSLVNALVSKLKHLRVSISHTTRPMRPGEADSQSYHFVDEATFKQMVADDAFLEHATVFHHQYGTSKAWVVEQLKRGEDVILEIDWQGADQIRARYPGAVSVFIFPPSWNVLRLRLQTRAQDKADVIEARMAEAGREMAHYPDFDFLVINDDFDDALFDLRAIVRSQRLRRDFQVVHEKALLADLLKNC